MRVLADRARRASVQRQVSTPILLAAAKHGEDGPLSPRLRRSWLRRASLFYFSTIFPTMSNPNTGISHSLPRPGIASLLIPLAALLMLSSCTRGQAGTPLGVSNDSWTIGRSLFDPFDCLRDTIQRGESLFQLLSEQGISPLQSLQIINATEHIDHLARNFPGESYAVFIDMTGEPFELRYRRLDGRNVIVGGTAGSYWSRIDTTPSRISVMSAAGVLESSLYLAFMEHGLSPELLLEFADVFSWTVDFLTECRVGDRFRVVYTEEDKTGKTTLLGASYRKKDTTFVALALPEPDGRTGYYAPDGTNMRKTFLRSPLNYRRISSGFSHARYHPIHKTYRPHLGVDYAAARGTPVVSIGDGIVEYAGWKGGFGKYVKVKHTGGCATSYGHLSGYGRGVRRGARVTQGQVIGYVGSTGVSTGPHLDFRIYLSGRPVNPLRFSAPPAPPIESSKKPVLTFRAYLIQRALDTTPDLGSKGVEEDLSRILRVPPRNGLLEYPVRFVTAEPLAVLGACG